MRELLLKIQKDLAEKTDPNRPILTGHMVKMFVLRLLLGILIYAVINKFITNISIGQYVLVDFIFQLGDYFISFLKKK